MRKTLFLVLVFLSMVVLLLRFGSAPLSQILGYQSKAGLRVTSTPGATIFVNGVEVGQTPYQAENLKDGEVEVRLVEGDNLWQGKVKLTQGTVSLINRELAPTVASSSGEVLTLKPGHGVIITSTPGGIEVETDGKPVGKTPLLMADLPAGEHTFLLKFEGYLKRSIRASLPKSMSLQLDVDLAVAKVDLTPVTPALVSDEVKVVVKQTPTGFLRVRDKPSVNGQELGRALSGESLKLLDEQPGWFKVRLENGIEGYAAAGYIQK